MIRVQQLTELEEVIEFKKALESKGRGLEPLASQQRCAFIQQLWASRLRGVQKNVEASRRLLPCACT